MSVMIQNKTNYSDWLLSLTTGTTTVWSGSRELVLDPMTENINDK